MRSPLLDLYIADPAWRVSRNDYPGTQFDTGTWVGRYPSVGTGSTVVLAFGTNDLATEASVQAVKADARAAIVAVTDAGAVRAVVPTLNETTAASLGRLERTRQWNAWLWQAENSLHPDYRALDVVDGAAVSAGRTDWVAADQLHHNAAGQAAYARFLYDARLP